MVLLLSATFFALLLSEAGLRWFDGYSVFDLQLISNRSDAMQYSDVTSWEHAKKYVQSHPGAATIDKNWFDLDPPRHANAVDPALYQRYLSHPGAELPSNYEWNKKFLLDELCGTSDSSLQNLSDFLVFEPVGGAPRPRYRFPQNKTLPTGLTTNAFGWRGPQITLNRPAGTIRVAFVGASTTVAGHSYPFSYPEYVGNWLNVWARSQNLPFGFEIINAGREGTASSDFAAVVRDELLPADPDLVIYYEGSNQFWPTYFIQWPSEGPPPQPKRTFKKPSWAVEHSAIARRVALSVAKLTEGREPNKPPAKVSWPSTLDEFDPDISGKVLPLSLPDILADMQEIKQSLDSIKSTLVVSSFIWLAYDGMWLDLPRQQTLFTYLNDTLWPFRYAHIRRMADFQNRVFKRFAADNGLPFLDVAGVFPQDSELFADAIHMQEAGLKLQAWIVLQQLLPILEERIAAGTLPRPLRVPPLTVHRAFAEQAKLMTKAEIERQCPSPRERDQERIARVAVMSSVLERYRKESGHYPVLPSGYAWGECSGPTTYNWLPDGNDFTWSKRYIRKMPTELRIACNYPFDPKHVGKTQFMYYSDNGRRYAIVAGLEDASLPESLLSRGTDWLPQWFRSASGFNKQWWEGTYVVTGGEE